MRESQKIEGLGLPFPSPLPVVLRESSKLDQSRFLRVQFQPELPHPLPQLVEDRMNLTGARWSLTGAEAVLRLRALRSSNDFDAYWNFHEQQEYERNHASHYANHCVPETVQPSRRSTLKIVKKK